MVMIFGLLMVVVLVGCVLFKGFVVVGFGMMIGIIGIVDVGGLLWMVFYDYLYLIDGLKLVIVGLGIFVIFEIVLLLC